MIKRKIMHKLGKKLIIIGISLITVSLIISIKNIYEEEQAGKNSANVLNIMKENIFNEETLNCIYNSNLTTKEATTNNQGYASFNNLDLGLYLIEQTNKVDGYSKIDPFLIYMPKFEENKWIYEINAIPKVDIIRLFD